MLKNPKEQLLGFLDYLEVKAIKNGNQELAYQISVYRSLIKEER